MLASGKNEELSGEPANTELRAKRDGSRTNLLLLTKLPGEQSAEVHGSSSILQYNPFTAP